MAPIFDLAVTIAIGGVLYKFVSDAIKYSLANKIYNEKVQLSLLYQTIIGMCIILLVYFLGKKNLVSKNIKHGLIFGSVLLILEAIMLNWNKLDDKTRIILLGCSLLIVLAFTYIYRS